ncbi:hypothetical protein IW140_002302 [Coemansia sp. RSA 1813]|nr:hypothetical protein IW140_002302 [Coemansia sp. RSA 1813]
MAIVDILLALERGGVDMLDFVASFTEPLVDEPASKSDADADADADAKQSIVSETHVRGIQAPVRFNRSNSHKSLHGKTILAKNNTQTGYVGYIPLTAPLTSKGLVRRRVKTAGSLVCFVTHSGIASIRYKAHKYADLPSTIDIGSHLRSVFCNAERGRNPKHICHYTEEASAKAKKNTPCAAPLSKIDEGTMEKSTFLPDKFGIFGGVYVAEALYECALELEKTYVACKNDPAFWEEFHSFCPYMGCPIPLHFAERLTERCGGTKIYLKREDLCHTGSHKINNVVGQILIAKHLGKSRSIAGSDAGQHGVATAAICAKLGLECTIYIDSEDMRCQSLNVFRIRALGGKVGPVTKGSCTLKDAINEAMRDLVSNLNTTYHLVSSAIGCYPFPTMARDF